MVAWASCAALAGVTVGPANDADMEQVVLVLGDGDPRPRVAAVIGEDDRVHAYLDVIAGPTRLGSIAAARLGIDVVENRGKRSAVLPWVRIGDLVMTDLDAEVEYGEELVIGTGDLGIPTAVLPSMGVVRFGRPGADIDLASIGEPVSAPDGTLVDGDTRWSGDVVPSLDARTSSLGAATLGPATLLGSTPSWWVDATVAGIELPAGWWSAGVGAGPAVAGADSLAGHDLGYDPTTRSVAIAPAATFQYVDAAVERLTWLVPDAQDWDVPEATPESVPEGDPGDLVARHRWSELAERSWAAGDVPLALSADEALVRVAGDRCELHLDAGVRALRAGEPTADAALQRAAAIYEAWTSLEPTERAVVRSGGVVPRQLSIEQDERCARAAMFLDLRRGEPPETLDVLGPWDGLAAGLVAWRNAVPSEAPLRHAIGHGGRLEPAVRLALAVVGRHPRSIDRIARLDDPAPLATAVALADAFGVAALRDVDSLSARLVRAAAGTKEPGGLVETAELERRRRPGDPAADCRASLAERLAGSVAPMSARPVADCLAARLLAAEAAGDLDAALAVRRELVERWPELAMSADDPTPSRVRTMPQPAPEPDTEEPMIAAIAATLATAPAIAADFDHTHAKLGEVLAGAVSTAGVDYGTLASRRATLDGYLESVASADASGFSNSQKLAFYVNAYNAYTIRTMLDEGPPGSIMDLEGGKVWDVRKFDVAGQSLTLNQMEHENARKLADGRVHAAVNCASKGCPPLPAKPMTESGQGSHLDGAAKQWAATNAYTLDGTTIKLSKIFDWYGDDFTKENQGDIEGVDGKAENALWFLSKYVDDATKEKLVSGTLSADWQEYDWSLNKR